MARAPQAAPQWLKWVLFLFIVYAAYLHFTSRGETEAVRTSNAVNMGVVGSPARHYQSGNVTIGGDIPGTGEEALCGQQAVARVTGKFPDGSVITGTGGEQPLTLQVGAASADFPWASGLIGMKTGGIREVLLPSDALSEEVRQDKNLESSARLQYRVELVSLTPHLPKESMPFRAFELTQGRGDEAQCGDRVTVHIDLWNSDGTLLYSSMQKPQKTPLELVIGRADLIYGIDRGLLGMREGGGRSLIIPPAYANHAQSSREFAEILSALPEDSVVLADITLVKKIKP